jgi:hypothetical protein
MLNVICINGISYAGKDTFVDFVENAIGKENVARMSTIDPIKLIYKEFFGWNEEKTPFHRKNLNTLKNIWRDVTNGPIEYVAGNIKSCQDKKIPYLFVMVREFDEMMSIKQLALNLDCNGFTLNVLRNISDIPAIEVQFLKSHPKDFQYDISIINPTVINYPKLPKLEFQVEKFLKETNYKGEIYR